MSKGFLGGYLIHDKSGKEIGTIALWKEAWEEAIADAVAEAVAAEREACAKICDEALSESEAAAAIRARGEV